jgi:hypothetical protein
MKSTNAYSLFVNQERANWDKPSLLHCLLPLVGQQKFAICFPCLLFPTVIALNNHKEFGGYWISTVFDHFRVDLIAL